MRILVGFKSNDAFDPTLKPVQEVSGQHFDESDEVEERRGVEPLAPPAPDPAPANATLPPLRRSSCICQGQLKCR